MPNPFQIATEGKGFFHMLERGLIIGTRYGFTSRKIDRAIGILMNTLKQFACPATITVTANTLTSNGSMIKKYQSQDLEFAIHGFAHQDYTQLSLQKQIDHIRQAQLSFSKNIDVQPAGFRSPYLRWNMDTLTALRERGFLYDSSQALAWDTITGLKTNDYQRALDFYHARSATEYPALPSLVNEIVQIPYCLPDDEALVERFHLSEGRLIAQVWLRMLDSIYQAGELFTLGLHPERVPICQEALKAVLEKARSLSPSVWMTRLDEIASWYCSLGQASFDIRQETTDRFRIKIQAPPQAVILIRSLDVMGTTQPWIQGYQSVLTNDYILQSNKRPLIGLSPNCPGSLKHFLRCHGYLIEVSSDPRLYSYYLNRSIFSPEDERPLLTELEKGDWPIVRLSRWPKGVRCALVITGDIDAISLWDYGRRIWKG